MENYLFMVGMAVLVPQTAAAEAAEELLFILEMTRQMDTQEMRMEEKEKPLPPFTPQGGRATPSKPPQSGKDDEDPRAYRQVARMLKPGEYELGKAQLIRPVYSERQLLEMMVAFWVNHFFVGRPNEVPQQDYEERVIRPRALGKFEDMLKATAQHPSMVQYLDNSQSGAPVEVIKTSVSVILSSYDSYAMASAPSSSANAFARSR